MSARKWEITFMVGMFKCELTYHEAGDLKAKWTPDLPLSFQRQSPEMLKQWRAGRDALLQQVAQDTGLNTMVLEI